MELELLATSGSTQVSHPLVLYWMRFKNLAELGITTPLSDLRDDEAAILEFCEVVYTNAKNRKR